MTPAPDNTAQSVEKPALTPCAAPDISTARLTLRRFRRGDWPAFAAALTSGRAVYMGGPFDTGAARAFFCSVTGAWSGTGALAVEAEGVAVGEVSLKKVRRPRERRAMIAPALPRRRPGVNRIARLRDSYGTPTGFRQPVSAFGAIT